MRAMLAIFLGLTATFLGLGHWRSESGLIHAFDTGIYLQILSNLLAGRGWMSSIVQETQFLAHHFQPVILLLLPFHLLSSSTWMLLAVGWLVATITGLYLVYELPRQGLASRTQAGLAALALFLHPTLSSRMYYSFVPEVLALPALAFLACCLTRPQRNPAPHPGFILLALVFVGLCKENLWLVSAWIAWLLAVQKKNPIERMAWAGVGVALIGIMLFLFLHWMPGNSSMK